MTVSSFDAHYILHRSLESPLHESVLGAI